MLIFSAAPAVAERGRMQWVAVRAVGEAKDPAIDDPIHSALCAGLDDRFDAGPTQCLTVVRSASDETCLAADQTGFSSIGALFANRLWCSSETALSVVAAHPAMVISLGAAAGEAYCRFASGKAAGGFLGTDGAKVGSEVCSACAAHRAFRCSSGDEPVVAAD